VSAGAAPPLELASVLAAIEPIEGWLTTAQAEHLWDAARRPRPPARIVEIGSFRGRSTIVLALAAAPGVEVVAIDPHRGGDRGPREIRPQPELGQADYEAFLDNLARAGVGDRVQHVRRPSWAALPEVVGPVELLFVDGAHRLGLARCDLREWGARVPAGGRMLVHDAFSSVGVTLALACEVIAREGWRYRGRVGSLADYERTRERSRRGRARELAAALAELPWFGRNLIVKALLVVRLPAAARLLGHRSGSWPH
jgi:hypothetical protein